MNELRRLTPHQNGVRILHVSDLHFGKPSVPRQVEALEAVIRRESFGVIVVSGDLSQRTRTREFRRAQEFVRLCDSRAPTVVIPGNHDTAWWMAPLGIGSLDAMLNRYRRYIRQELEPAVRVPGATIVAVNSSHGIQPYTLTLRLRDLSVVGAVRHEQWERARQLFALAPPADLRILVLHHNLLRGRLSNRWGLASRAGGIASAARTGADVVLCGHDHEEHIADVTVEGRRLVVSTANTLSNMTRGHRPGSWNIVTADAAHICVELWEWRDGTREFARTRRSCYARQVADTVR